MPLDALAADGAALAVVVANAARTWDIGDAALAGDVAALKSAIEAGADVNIANGQGVHPLMTAARDASPECVLLLLDAGADLHRATRKGCTALHLARVQRKRWVDGHGSFIAKPTPTDDAAIARIIEQFDDVIDLIESRAIDKAVAEHAAAQPSVTTSPFAPPPTASGAAVLRVEGAGAYSDVNGDYKVDVAAGLKDGVPCYIKIGDPSVAFGNVQASRTITRRDGKWWIASSLSNQPPSMLYSAASTGDKPPPTGWGRDGCITGLYSADKMALMPSIVPLGGLGPASPFGAAPAVSPFGVPAPAPAVGFGGFGGGAGFGGAAAPGTGNPPYRPVQEREQVAGAPGQVQVYQYCSITKMAQYEAASFEELRSEDYAKGNTGAVVLRVEGAGAYNHAQGDPEDKDSDAWTLAAWASSQPIGKAISQAITEASRECSQPKTSEELLALLLSLACAEAGRTQLFTYLREGGVIEKLVSEMWPGLQQLATRSLPDSNETHGSRFVQGQGFELSYGDLNVFFGGLEAIVGSPHPMVEEGMSREHCTSVDSFVPFTTDNYLIRTTSQVEWWFVVDPTGALLSPERLGSSYQALGLTPSSSYPVENAARLANGAKPRAPRALADFDAELCATNARLEEHHQTPCGREELVGARLYTGPMYMKVLQTASLSLPLSLSPSPSPSFPLSLSSPPISHKCGPVFDLQYNAVLRGLQLDFAKASYETLCMGNKYTTTLHAINSAVVKLSKLTVATRVYRGVSGGRLPSSFRVPNAFNVRGGIDCAFMSTTRDRKVAIHYAGSQGGHGVVFSMQQGMIDRGADISWLSQYPHEQEVLFAPLTGLEVQTLGVSGSMVEVYVRLSVNLQSMTIDQVIGRSRKLLCDIAANAVLDTRSNFDPEDCSLQQAIDSSGCLAHPPAWYNVVEHFKDAVACVVEAQSATTSKLAGYRFQRTSSKLTGDTIPQTILRKRPTTALNEWVEGAPIVRQNEFVLLFDRASSPDGIEFALVQTANGTRGYVQMSYLQKEATQPMPLESELHMPFYWEQRLARNTLDGFAAIPLLDEAVLQTLQGFLVPPDASRFGQRCWPLRSDEQHTPPYTALKLRRAWRLENPDNFVQYAIAGRQVARECQKLPHDAMQRAVTCTASLLTASLAKQLPGRQRQESNEAILLHGTSPEALVGILSVGMNERFSGKLGSNFGDGIYLAEDPVKADQYAGVDGSYDRKNPLHQRLFLDAQVANKDDAALLHPGCEMRYILVCRVCMGATLRVDDFKNQAINLDDCSLTAFSTPTFRELNFIKGVSPPTPHHSLLVEKGMAAKHFREIVIFHGQYIYPEYLIAYEHINSDAAPCPVRPTVGTCELRTANIGNLQLPRPTVGTCVRVLSGKHCGVCGRIARDNHDSRPYTVQFTYEGEQLGMTQHLRQADLQVITQLDMEQHQREHIVVSRKTTAELSGGERFPCCCTLCWREKCGGCVITSFNLVLRPFDADAINLVRSAIATAVAEADAAALFAKAVIAVAVAQVEREAKAQAEAAMAEAKKEAQAYLKHMCEIRAVSAPAASNASTATANGFVLGVDPGQSRPTARKYKRPTKK